MGHRQHDSVFVRLAQSCLFAPCPLHRWIGEDRMRREIQGLQSYVDSARGILQAAMIRVLEGHTRRSVMLSRCGPCLRFVPSLH